MRTASTRIQLELASTISSPLGPRSGYSAHI